MKTRLLTRLGPLVLATVFTVGLTFATVDDEVTSAPGGSNSRPVVVFPKTPKNIAFVPPSERHESPPIGGVPLETAHSTTFQEGVCGGLLESART